MYKHLEVSKTWQTEHNQWRRVSSCICLLLLPICIEQDPYVKIKLEEESLRTETHNDGKKNGDRDETYNNCVYIDVWMWWFDTSLRWSKSSMESWNDYKCWLSRRWNDSC